MDNNDYLKQYCIAYKTKKEPFYQFSFWKDFDDIEECFEELKLYPSTKKVQYKIALINKKGETILIENDSQTNI